MTARDLVTDLGRAYREGRLDPRLRIYLAPKVLIMDEMGYLPLDELGARRSSFSSSAYCSCVSPESGVVLATRSGRHQSWPSSVDHI